MKIMKKIFTIIMFVGIGAAPLHAQKKTFVRDYIYQAGEADSKLTARANATTQMRNILLSEVGQYLHVERTLKQDDTSEEFSQKIEAITAGIVDMKTLDEQWDGVTYYIKAEMAVDPAEVNKRIAEVLNDKQKTQELEEARKRTLAAEAEAARLRKELEATKDEQQRLALQKTYAQTADALSAEEYFTKGTNAYENKFNELAIEYFQKAIEINPNNAEAYYNMGSAYDDLKNYDEAILCYQKALEINPNNARAYLNMGYAYKNLKNYDEAIRCYRKAITLDSNYLLPYTMLIFLYEDLKSYQEVIWCSQEVLNIKPNDIMAYIHMGFAYKNLEYYSQAIWYLEKALELKPNLGLAYYGIGVAYSELGNKEEGIKNYQQAARLGDSLAQEILRKEGYSW
jgi:superkiller protein 3